MQKCPNTTYTIDFSDAISDNNEGSLHGQRGESRVVEVGIETDEYSLHGLQVFGIEYIASYLQRVNLLSCGESIGIVAHRVALVVVRDGVGEVDSADWFLLMLF